MSHSMYGASRSTHVKVVVVGLVGAIIVSVAGIAARMNNVSAANERGQVQVERIVIRAAPNAVTSNPQGTIR